jgi:CDP-diacylglycerol--glycerol-3-phosphate 3-phosphatidyltransferase
VISERIGYWVRDELAAVGRFLAKTGISPNLLTVLGLLLNIGVAAVIAAEHPRWGGLFLLFASAFDMLDGAVARTTGAVSRFGGFLDSTLDRYSEMVVYFGLMLYLFTTDDDTLGPILVFVSAVGAMMISYARARAEAAGFKASVGLVARPERVVVLAAGLMLNQPIWALWILAVTTHLTALTRIFHVWQLSQGQPGDPAVAAAAAAASAPARPTAVPARRGGRRRR